MCERHRYYDEIIAFLNGESIQFRFVDTLDSNAPWISVKDISLADFDSTEFEFRVAPKSVPWYENIPEKGILCWVSDSSGGVMDRVFIVLVKGYDEQAERYKFQSNQGAWALAEPVTEKEILNYLYKESTE